MPTSTPFDDGARRLRSPAFPFISLGKAIVRARSIAERYGRHPVSLAAAGEAWRYAPKSSGLLQTLAALRSYGLIEDVGRAEERKIQLSDLGWRILHDTRSDARQAAIREAATRPRSIAEYALKWLPSRPSDDECISELHLDRGFSPQAAKRYLTVFDQTAVVADLACPDKLSYNSQMAGQFRISGRGGGADFARCGGKAGRASPGNQGVHADFVLWGSLGGHGGAAESGRCGQVYCRHRGHKNFAAGRESSRQRRIGSPVRLEANLKEYYLPNLRKTLPWSELKTC